MKAELKVLQKRMGRPPLDLTNLLQNWQLWKTVCESCIGILPLIIGFKFPVAREVFFTHFRPSDHAEDLERHTFDALVKSALVFRNESERARLRNEIDTIKGPLLCHGFVTYLGKLRVVKPCDVSSAAALFLGASNQAYCVQPFTRGARQAIRSFLNVGPVLASLAPCASVSAYATAQAKVLESFTKNKVPQLLSTQKPRQYNREWTFRCFALAEARLAGVQRLYYSSTDPISSLPGPDVKQVRKDLLAACGGGGTIAEMYTKLRIAVPPEYVCMAACLSRGKYKAKAVSSSAAQKRLQQGRCLHCFLGRRSVHYCRVVSGHTASARKAKPTGRKRKHSK